MSGWEIDTNSIKVEHLEETNPDIYDSKSLTVARKGNYAEALHYAKKALEYRENNGIADCLNALSYHVRILEILFCMGKYDECLKYIQLHKFLDYIGNSHAEEMREKKRGALSLYTNRLREDVAYFFTIYVECWKKTHWVFAMNDWVVIYPDGSGMVSDLQRAIDSGYENIVCLGKWDGENDTRFVGECRSKHVNLIFLPFTRGFTDWGHGRRPFVELTIYANADVAIINSTLNVSDESVVINNLGGETCLAETLIESGLYSKNKRGIGIYTNGSGKLVMNNCQVIGMTIGLLVEGGESNLHLVEVGASEEGIIVSGNRNVTSVEIDDCVIGGYSNFNYRVSHIGEVALLASHDSRIIVRNSDLSRIYAGGEKESDWIENETLEVYDSEVDVASAYNGGSIFLDNCKVDELETENAKIVCNGRQPLYHGRLRVNKGEGSNIQHDSIDCPEESRLRNKSYVDIWRYSSLESRKNWLLGKR